MTVLIYIKIGHIANYLTRAPLGGGGGYFEPPLSFSCNIFQTNADITTKLAVTSLPTILHIV